MFRKNITNYVFLVSVKLNPSSILRLVKKIIINKCSIVLTVLIHKVTGIQYNFRYLNSSINKDVTLDIVLVKEGEIRNVNLLSSFDLIPTNNVYVESTLISTNFDPPIDFSLGDKLVAILSGTRQSYAEVIELTVNLSVFST